MLYSFAISSMLDSISSSEMSCSSKMFSRNWSTSGPSELLNFLKTYGTSHVRICTSTAFVVRTLMIERCRGFDIVSRRGGEGQTCNDASDCSRLIWVGLISPIGSHSHSGTNSCYVQLKRDDGLLPRPPQHIPLRQMFSTLNVDIRPGSGLGIFEIGEMVGAIRSRQQPLNAGR